MPSSTNSPTAIVDTVDRRATGALPSLEASVAGDAVTTPVQVRSASMSLTARRDAPTMTTQDVAQIAIFVHQLLQANSSASPTDGRSSRQWPLGHEGRSPRCATVVTPTQNVSPRGDA